MQQQQQQQLQQLGVTGDPSYAATQQAYAALLAQEQQRLAAQGVSAAQLSGLAPAAPVAAVQSPPRPRKRKGSISAVQAQQVVAAVAQNVRQGDVPAALQQQATQAALQAPAPLQQALVTAHQMPTLVVLTPEQLTQLVRPARRRANSVSQNVREYDELVRTLATAAEVTDRKLGKISLLQRITVKLRAARQVATSRAQRNENRFLVEARFAAHVAAILSGELLVWFADLFLTPVLKKLQSLTEGTLQVALNTLAYTVGHFLVKWMLPHGTRLLQSISPQVARDALIRLLEATGSKDDFFMLALVNAVTYSPKIVSFCVAAYLFRATHPGVYALGTAVNALTTPAKTSKAKLTPMLAATQSTHEIAKMIVTWLYLLLVYATATQFGLQAIDSDLAALIAHLIAVAQSATGDVSEAVVGAVPGGHYVPASLTRSALPAAVFLMSNFGTMLNVGTALATLLKVVISRASARVQSRE